MTFMKIGSPYRPHRPPCRRLRTSVSSRIRREIRHATEDRIEFGPVTTFSENDGNTIWKTLTKDARLSGVLRSCTGVSGIYFVIRFNHLSIENMTVIEIRQTMTKVPQVIQIGIVS